ncbi:sigmaY antisigma factor [Bacillus freudenreichii]|nr:sigmaY antisigma factor [Bacillus freudenreichii]
MKEGKENEWIEPLMNDLRKLEETQQAEVPQQSELMDTLAEFKRKRKKAWKRELAIFIFTALTILATYFVVSLKMPAVFLWVQVLAIITIPIIYAAEKKRRRSLNEVLDDGF